jgi:hypothetical protein
MLVSQSLLDFMLVGSRQLQMMQRGNLHLLCAFDSNAVGPPLLPQGRPTGNMAIIQTNPEQSKHLETARVKLADLWIDVVNLRSETYASDSRIPSMQFGTPLQVSVCPFGYAWPGPLVAVQC